MVWCRSFQVFTCFALMLTLNSGLTVRIYTPFRSPLSPDTTFHTSDLNQVFDTIGSELFIVPPTSMFI